MVLWGPFWGRFWAHFGVVLGCFAVRWPNTKTLIFDDPLERNRVFSGPWGSKNQSKIGPESLLALDLAPKASWRPLGLDFWTLWGSQNGPPRGLESKLKFETFFGPLLGRGGWGPAAGGPGRWEGTLGESTYGRRWVSEAVLVTVLSVSPSRFAHGPLLSLKGSVAGSKGLLLPSAS